MKKPGIVLLIMVVFVGYLQGQTKILSKTLKVEHLEGTAGGFLEEISRKGGFVFSYNQDIPADEKVRLTFRRQTVHQFLDEIFEGKVYYLEYGNRILLKMKPRIPEVYTVSGKVIDSETGKSVPGVAVIIPGTDPLQGSVSDESGMFSIQVPVEMDVIRFTCIGYQEHDLKAGLLVSEQVELTPSRLEISEAVITNYVLPVDKTSAIDVSYITGERLEKIQGSSIEHALIGAAPGVYVVRNSGMPGSSFQVKIRGTHSLINSDPVYYLDGIPIQSALLNALSPQDISSVEINKDATSTAIYGARAGNGVVQLHSKKGHNESAVVRFDYYMGVQQAARKLDLMNTEDYLEYFELVRPEDPIFDTLPDLYENNTDWMELVFHSAKTEDYHLSVWGGNDRSEFYLGTGYFNQASIIKELHMYRYSVKFGSRHRIFPKWQISQDFNLSHIRYEGLKEGCFLNDYNNPLLASMCMLPITPPADTLMQVRFGRKDTIPDNTVISQDISYLDAELTDNVRKNYAVFGNLTSKVELMRNLDLRTVIGYEVLYQNNWSCNRSFPISVGITQNPVIERNYKVLDLGIYFRNDLYYQNIFAQHHRVELLAGFEYGQNESDWIPVTQQQLNLAHAANTVSHRNQSVSGERYNSGVQNRAFTGSFSYIYKEKYILNGSLRREAVIFDSISVKKVYDDLYPALSVGWVFMNRNQAVPRWMQYGKIRYAWGMAGNSPRLNYSFYSRFMREIAYVYSFNSSGAITNSAEQRQTNEKFYWEKYSAHDLGIDLGFLNNRLYFSADLFYNHLYPGEISKFRDPLKFVGQLYIRDQFGIIQLPLSEMINYGIEGQVQFKNAGKRLHWDAALNLTHLRNRIIDVEDQLRFSFFDPIPIYKAGEPAGSFYGYKIERIFTEEDCPFIGETVTNQPYVTDEDGNRTYAQPNARAGDYKFADINGDNVIDRNDRTIIGNPIPDLSFGLYFNAYYRQFDLMMFWQGTYGNEIYNATKLWLYNPYGSSNWTTEILKSYRSPQYDESGTMVDPGLTGTDLHRFDYYAENKNLRVSEFYIEDGSYLRLKNIQLGYTINPVLTSRMHIRTFRIYFSVQNLFTFTNYSGLDPEVGGWGIDCGNYPQPRTFYAGVNLEF
ncbi:MAG: SusC/RagA family TonB-linked outer membrane protein [Bacteroidales bacterium]